MKTSSSNLRTTLLNAALITATIPVPSLQAANLYWDTNGTATGSGNASGDWNAGTNWNATADGTGTTQAWADAETAVFSAGTDGTNFTATVTGTVAPAGIVFEQAGNTVTLTGGTITVGGTTIDSSALGAGTNQNIVIGSELAGSGGLTIASHGSLAASGGGSNSDLDLTGTNTFTGDLTITSGLVSWTTDAAFGDVANKIVLNGGGLLDPNRALTLSRDLELAGNGFYRVYGSVSSTITGNISGPGDLTKTDGGVLIIESTANPFSGRAIVQGGFLRLANETSLGATPGSVTGNSIVLENGAKLQGGTSAGGGDLTISANRGITINSGNSGFHTIGGATTTVDSPIVGAGSLSKTNGGTAIINGAITITGELRAEGGILDVRSSAPNITTARVRNGTSTLNIGTGADISVERFVTSDSSSAKSFVNQSGGTLNITGTLNNSNQNSSYVMGHWGAGGATSAYELSGGTINSIGAELKFGWDSNDVTFTQTGGDHNILGLDFNSGRNNTAIYNLNGGNLTLGASGISAASNKVLNLGGGTIKASANGTWAGLLATQPSTTSTIDVDGNLVNITSDITGDGTIELTDTAGGGTITIDTAANSRTIDASLAGTATLAKNGTGILDLTGTSTHSGDFLVNAGTLNLTGSTDSNIDIKDGVTLAGEGSTSGNLVIGAATGASLSIDPVTPEALGVGGNLTLSGVNTVVLNGPPGGIIPLFTYGGTLSGSAANLSLPDAGNFRPVSFDVATPGEVNLVFNDADLTWLGTSGTWDFNNTADWDNSGGSDTFFWADKVTFDDSSPTALTAVTLSGELAPGMVTVDSNTSDYVLTGSGGNFISGSGSLLKTGTSTLTLDAPNTYSGGTVISQGAVQVRQSGALGSGIITLGDSNTGSEPVALYLDSNRISFGTPVLISGEGTGTATLGSLATVTGSGNNNRFSNVTLAGDVIFDSNASDRTDYDNVTGSGNISVIGSGRSIFSTTPAAWVGDLTVSAAGGLQVGVASTAGDRVPDASHVTITSGGLVRLSTTAETIAGLNGSGGTLDTNAPSGGTATLTVGSNDADGDYSGLLQNGAGVLAVTKSGEGTQTLTGVNTHTGITTINAGTLRIDGEEALGANPGGFAANQLTLDGGTLAVIGSFSIDDANRGITTSSAGTFEVPTGAVLTVPAVITGGGTITKSGDGLLISTGGTWTGQTTVAAGTLEVPSKSGNVAYTIAQGATLKVGYNTGGGYTPGMTLNGSGVADPAGLYLKGGIDFRTNGNMVIQTAPTTIRTYDAGTATLGGFDINGTDLTLRTESSGSVIDSTVNIGSPGFGFRMNIESGANTATGDLTIDGAMTGSGSVGRADIQVNMMKYGAGSILINGVSTFPEGFWLRDGSVILGGNDRIAPSAGLAMGDGGTSGTLVMNGFNQTFSDIGNHNGNSGSTIINGSATPSTLTINYNGAGRTFSGDIGGLGNDGNIALVKSGTGTFSIDGAIAYSGDTTIEGGTLSLAVTGLDDASVLNINASGSLDLSHGSSDTVDALYFDGIQQASGTWGATGSGATNIDNSRFSGTGTINVTTDADPYDTWLNANNLSGSNALATTDVESDGLVNILEFGFGTNPTVSDNAPLAIDGSVNGTPVIQSSGGVGGITFEYFFVRRTDHGTSGSVTYTAQFSNDMGLWYDSGATPTFVANSTAGYQVVKIAYPAILPNGKKARFARMKVDPAP